MSPSGLSLLDAVALLVDLPAQGLVRGQVGAVVEDDGGAAVLVEFVDDEGRTLATPLLRRSDLLPLKGVPVAAE